MSSFPYETHYWLYKSQYEFRKGHSTNQAIIELGSKLTQSRRKEGHARLVFGPIRCILSYINHTILIHKLQYNGIRGHALNWFTSYLTNRKQYTVYNDTHSAQKSVCCDVPQGSLLGTLPFIIYIDDLFNA